MGNFETFLSIAATILVLLSSSIGLLIKLIKAIKERNAERVSNILLESSREAVKLAETLSGYSGADKKELALLFMRDTMKKNKVKFDEDKASIAIENVIALSKSVNAKEQNK